MFAKIKQIYNSLFTTIRAKLIGIISLIILTSLLLFTGISLNLFQSNMSEMVKLNNGNNAKMLSDKLESELRSSAEQLRLLSVLSREGATVINAYFKDSTDYLLVADFAVATDEPAKLYYREGKLEKLNLSVDDVKPLLRFTAEEAQKLRQGQSIIRSLNSPRQHVWLYAVPAAEKGSDRTIAAVMNGDPG